MLKTFLTSIIILLISATAYGQLLSPKRIIFEKDTGIFFSSPQEIMLLVKMKQLEACQEEKAQWILYANKADKLSKLVDKNEVLSLLGVKSSDNVAVQVCSAKTFKGLVEGFDWLFGKIKI